MAELKPCPFCGGIARIFDYGGLPFVKCSSCTIETRESADAVEIWNTRSTDERVRELIEHCQIARDAANRIAERDEDLRYGGQGTAFQEVLYEIENRFPELFPACKPSEDNQNGN